MASASAGPGAAQPAQHSTRTSKAVLPSLGTEAEGETFTAAGPPAAVRNVVGEQIPECVPAGGWCDPLSV
jgi:hypothetical protein